MSPAPAPATDSPGLKIGPPQILIADLVVGFALRWVRPLPMVGPDLVVEQRAFGIVLIVLWLGIAIWAVMTFRGVHTTPNPWKPTTALAFDGPYRLSRNPMYLGLMLMFVGVALVANDAWLLVTAAVSFLLLGYAVIAREERYLEGKFGAVYTQYKARVRRWI